MLGASLPICKTNVQFSMFWSSFVQISPQTYNMCVQQCFSFRTFLLGMLFGANVPSPEKQSDNYGKISLTATGRHLSWVIWFNPPSLPGDTAISLLLAREQIQGGWETCSQSQNYESADCSLNSYVSVLSLHPSLLLHATSPKLWTRKSCPSVVCPLFPRIRYQQVWELVQEMNTLPGKASVSQWSALCPIKPSI